MVKRNHYRGRAKNHPLAGGSRSTGLPQVYGGRGRRNLRDLYEVDHGSALPGGRFRWLLSTVLAAAVGSVAIFTIIYGSVDSKDTSSGLLPALARISSGELPVPSLPNIRRLAGLNWFTPKSDRMVVTSSGQTTRFVIQEKLTQRRNGRDYIHAKPYVRIVSRLAPPDDDVKDKIPAFNPYKLYANSAPIQEGDEETDRGPNRDVVVRIIELIGGILPIEDRQQLDDADVRKIVQRDIEAFAVPIADAAGSVAGDNDDLTSISDQNAPNTTTLAKTVRETEDTPSDIEDGELTIVRVGKGETLQHILTKAGADRWQAAAMIEAARGIFKESDLRAGNEVHVTLVSSLTDPNTKEPARFSVFADGHIHQVTVTRGPAGEFEATRTPVGAEAAVRALLSDDDTALQNTNLYASIYGALLEQGLTQQTIQQILKVHAYETDYRRRLRAGDQVELFYDVKEQRGGQMELGELLYTSITAGGETSEFYRYRTPDGVVDYYDDDGSNSKKFLMRRPVRSANVRLTSGFGQRFHPLLNRRRMHTGVDWAAPTGTPILAAGNGTIEQAGRKGHYGNYVRIRHANGYQTAYGHMSRIGKGIREGIKIRQGQVIGYIGTTGLSSGPHLHFEVLVNSQFVNPMSIQVPRERQLEAKDLAQFQRERAHIEELMRRAPLQTAQK
ncbi:MAG: M23 family metallopeptidase [Hyphomicrobiaceae bacterium]|nr:M23 family metallopeptidase [Hyphomicrobiaceae bacterium]MCC0011021.1 M23 family metallopeptidase [Hyphomicrobiaceae bacterium]